MGSGIDMTAFRGEHLPTGCNDKRPPTPSVGDDNMESMSEKTVPKVLRHPGYLHLAASRVLTALASQAMTIAVGWMIYDLTHSAFALGFVGLCQFLPRFILTLVVGQVADRFDRRKIILVCQVVQVVVALAIASAIWQGWITAPLIFAAVTILGAATAFQQPTTVALLPNVVPPSILQQAVATTTSLQQAAFIIGPAAGGLLYGLHPTLPFLISALFLVIASFNIVSIRIERRVPSKEPVTLTSVFAGVAFVRSRPVILGAISLDLFAVLLGGATALMPMFARDILHAGPWGLGFLRAAPGIGALFMAVLLARRPLKTNVGKRMMIACAVFGLATVAFSLSTRTSCSPSSALAFSALPIRSASWFAARWSSSSRPTRCADGSAPSIRFSSAPRTSSENSNPAFWRALSAPSQPVSWAASEPSSWLLSGSRYFRNWCG
jgi:MFS family permease